ncbi:TonB C-terminal domain-containing protein [Methylomonas sp. SURF-2]|uniref:TonB C-terminal domain-containing protein n=1 Tax=Methylomonas subterranea TaxID=2952225 RepID=A0ABT1TE16_9GAMM|nr:TonB C-terminal domain-containing protein [Methylomonas sp. SURF-2]MCQ8103518.1 TonB C-terminal domain-containing protein [Methylomonas sp. SURF-2]
MTEHGKKHFRVYVPKIIGGVIALIVLFFFVKMVMHFLENQQEKPQRKIQPVTLVAPPPPPPPPPKVEPPPPEPEMEKIKEPEPEPEPEPMPDEAPARDLGLDADGSAGSDGFGLAARKGGTGLFGGGNPFAWYGGIIKNDIVNLLSNYEQLRRKGYTAVVKLWLRPDGSVDRFELSRGSNDAEIDQLLEIALNKYKRVNEAPPPGMKLPIKLKITSRV